MRHRVVKFDGGAGEIPPIKIGQLVVADDGSLYDAIQKITDEDLEDCEDCGGEDVPFPKELKGEMRDAINAVFTGAVVGRTDSTIKLKRIAAGELNGEIKEFFADDVIMILPITASEIKNKTLGWLEEMFDGMAQAMFDIIVESESNKNNRNGEKEIEDE